MEKISDRFENIWGCLAFCILLLVMFWAYLAVTPNQMSAECDFARAQMEGGVK